MPKVSDTRNKLLIVSGLTATGKTKLAVTLANIYNGELVSADSRQVYQGIDILSGKDKGDLGGIPLWLTDVADIHEQFSVSLYRKLATHAVEDISARAKLPIVVGGSGLYIQSIIDPPDTIDIPPDVAKRLVWNTASVVALQEELKNKDANRLARMNASDQNNPRRLIRALEIAEWKKSHPTVSGRSLRYDLYWIGLQCETIELQQRIKKRVDERWKHGALEEVRTLPPGFSATGIAAIRKFQKGEISAELAKSEWVREELSYARRQMTWFQKQKNIHWYNSSQQDLVDAVVDDIGAWYTKTQR